MLWLACRHHILELILQAVWKNLFGNTISNENPEVEEFMKRWVDVDTTLPVMTLCFAEEILINMRYETINCILDILLIETLRMNFLETIV